MKGSMMDGICNLHEELKVHKGKEKRGKVVPVLN
jgi:hypothetical protein